MADFGIFATESGTILAWRLTTTVVKVADVKVDSSAGGAVHKGLAIAMAAGGPQLYATDFNNSRVDVFNSAWAPMQTKGGFVDPSIPIPAGYAPFGIQTNGSRIFVTYAKQKPGTHDELDGPGLGFVDAYDTEGNLLVRVAQRGLLNAPWGLAMAPSNFGVFSGDLLVGNFGNGQINAYQEMIDGTFELVGSLRTPDGHKVAIDGLWALQFGHGLSNNPSSPGPNGLTNWLFFTAGPNGEADGLFGVIRAT